MADIKKIIHTLRYDFKKNSLDESTAKKNPYDEFELWMNEAIKKKLHEPNAMVLSTATKKGIPSSRVVLLRGIDKKGFVFYTNYTSKKGKDIAENPNAALLFYWAQIEKQVRVTGVISKISEKKSTDYFNSRPRSGQLGAWVSRQSTVIANRNILAAKYLELEQKLTGQKIERPEYWGGYVLKPASFEFWQGRESRLHDRLLYSKIKSGWMMERLSP